MFMKHPSEFLRLEEERLEELDREMTIWWKKISMSEA